MNSELFSEAMNELDIKYVNEAVCYKKRTGRFVWAKRAAAAACLCLVAAGGAVLAQNNILTNGSSSISDDDMAGGDFMGSSFSIAVYPRTENEKNVKKADAVSLTESEVLSHPLAKHLPKQLPEGYQFGRGTLFTTVMKNGTTYNMLRVEYTLGEIPEQKFSEDGGAIAPEHGLPKNFFVSVYDFDRTSADDHVYSSNKEITLSILEKNYGVWIRTEDHYVYVNSNTSERSAVLETIKTID